LADKLVTERPEILARCVSPLDEHIAALESASGELYDSFATECRLLELELRRLRERIRQTLGKLWLAKQLVGPN
jgi:hypothetical protein